MDIFEAEMVRRFVVAVEKIANALDRKDEPQRTCDNCGTPRDKCVYCIEEDKMWTPKTEPQTDNGIGCSKCESRFWCMDRDMPHAVHCNNYGKVADEPQTEVETVSCAECKHRPIGAEICEEPCHYEPQTDWHYDEQDATWYPYKHDDEPQTDCSWK